MKLIAFPFAGGSEHCYRELEHHLNGISFQPQALPGRGSLMSQSCITRIDKMVEFLFHQIEDQLDQPYAFFGHSMGAFIAYMLCRKIREKNLLMPQSLILSGRKAPSVVEDKIKHKLPDEQFKEMLHKLGGIPEAVWQDEEIMALFEPVLRADFELIETYTYQKQNALNVPIHLFIGKDDNISSDQAKAWSEEIEQPLNISFFEGGHFYFQNNWPLLAKKISQLLI